MFKMFKVKTPGFIKRAVVTMFAVISMLHASVCNKTEGGLIIILIWTPQWEPFNIIPLEKKGFENCTYNNCYLTENRTYLKNIMDFDVIMFNVMQVGVSNLDNESSVGLPANRSESQTYCMFGWEPAGFHSLPDTWNGFFNMTFTYKFSSNVSIPYIVVRDQNDRVIGPKVEMNWMKLSEMNETSDYVKSKLQNKRIAAAWIVSHCETPWRFFYVRHLQKELARYGHSLDIYGKCGTIPCSRDRMEDCLALIESDYYFYLSFENSFSEDYVSEKILYALEHFAVPIVFGGANYSRFMPEGIYLDANILPPDIVAGKINEAITDENKYYEFFKWHDHYSFHLTAEDLHSRQACALCAFLNKNKHKTSIIDDIAFWWNAEWPPWPEEIEEPNEIEIVVGNVLSLLDPE